MLLPGSEDLMMQIAEKFLFPPFRPRIRAAKESLVEFRRLRLAVLIRLILFMFFLLVVTNK